ncbi:acetyltransferase, partial [Vibrio cholerae]|nr:acetyltransferase [Vibrio cholerae]
MKVVCGSSVLCCSPLKRALCAEYWVHIHALMKNSDHSDL